MEARVAIEEQEGVFAVALDVSPVAFVDVAVGLQRRDRRAGLHLPGGLAAFEAWLIAAEFPLLCGRPGLMSGLEYKVRTWREWRHGADVSAGRARLPQTCQ